MAPPSAFASHAANARRDASSAAAATRFFSHSVAAVSVDATGASVDAFEPGAPFRRSPRRRSFFRSLRAVAEAVRS